MCVSKTAGQERGKYVKINNFKQLIKNDCQDTSLHCQEYHIINFKWLSSAVPIFSVLIFKEVCVC